ncbi:hypothetical protein, partial [Streptomyces lunaelactis]|uniref:hypothetical protein n=1 Tax=Streptomyces lunaelactis TaxID=1535768 RepID=UPI001C2F51C2
MRAIARRRIILVLDVPVGPHGGHAGSREPRPAPDRLPSGRADLVLRRVDRHVGAGALLAGRAAAGG